jgi:hypothetical protein
MKLGSFDNVCPTASVGASEKRAKVFKLHKNRVTVLVCADEDGSYRLKFLWLSQETKVLQDCCLW